MSGRIICFGELLLRFAVPQQQLLEQASALDIHVGGAEANVAVGLANLGHTTALVSVVPDNALGRMAIAALRSQGVDTSAVIERPGRMGLYFLTPGAGLRPSQIIYDRSGSSFSAARGDIYDWTALLDGATLLHLSGITPALGPQGAQAAVAAAEAARALHIPVSFDCNYRSLLWGAWDSKPKETLASLISLADILFGNHRDLSLVLGTEYSPGEGRARAAALDAFAAFPNLKLLASTDRTADCVDLHRLRARIDTRKAGLWTREVQVSGIVDRIGAGDAFAAGILHGHMLGYDAAMMAEAGLALGCLKHSLPGDASLFRPADIDAFMQGSLDVRR